MRFWPLSEKHVSALIQCQVEFPILASIIPVRDQGPKAHQKICTNINQLKSTHFFVCKPTVLVNKTFGDFIKWHWPQPFDKKPESSHYSVVSLRDSIQAEALKSWFELRLHCYRAKSSVTLSLWNGWWGVDVIAYKAGWLFLPVAFWSFSWRCRSSHAFLFLLFCPKTKSKNKLFIL